MKISIIGAGKWGMALSSCLAYKNSIFISSRQTRSLPNFVPLENALDNEYILMAISAQSTKEWLEKHPPKLGQKILVASKGIDQQALQFLDEIYKEYTPEKDLAFLAGPSFALELEKSLPTAFVIGSKSAKTSKTWAEFFPSFTKIYTSKDVRGLEIGGAYKNVISIAAGISDGFNLGNNARAALITRGLAEMTRFGIKFGAKRRTFLGLGGAGDLLLTASSELSRNYRVGLYLARGKKLDEILTELKEVAEGVPTTKAIYEICKTHNIYAPIVLEIMEILNGKDPQLSIKKILTGSNKKERL